MKKIVIFGGGTGLSQLLKGLKLFPVDVTAIVTVADSGRSTGKLRSELNIPAVGDISKVLLSMSNTDDDIMELMNYRFPAGKELESHSIKNLILAALLDTKGDFKHAIPVLEKLLNIKGRVLPITEENVNLVGIMDDGSKVIGEENVTYANKNIISLEYDKDVSISSDIAKAIKTADLIIFSSGSLLTSIIPNLLVKGITDEIKASKAKKMYVCNLVTQPGETNDFKASDHIKLLEKFLGNGVIDVILANDGKISDYIKKKYASLEQKDPVKLDESTLKRMNVSIIKDKIWKIEDNVLRHDSLKTAYLIFSYLMEGE
ncbi:MAG TPA: YvcK family protein [Bacilli bacterium]|nr:YvcK family protein [Bacilli bacterium]HQC84058.1 YvcK family protein [Bacilli bacterium]